MRQFNFKRVEIDRDRNITLNVMLEAQCTLLLNQRNIQTSPAELLSRVSFFDDNGIGIIVIPIPGQNNFVFNLPKGTWELI